MINFEKLFSIIRLAHRAFRGYRFQLGALTVLGFASGFFASIGVGAAIPLFSLATGQAIPGTDLPSRIVTTVLGFLHLPLNAAFLMGLIVVFFTGKALATFLAKLNADRIVTRYVCNQQQRLFGETMDASWPYLLEQKVGHMERVLLFDIAKGADIMSNISAIILILTSFLMYASIALSISMTVTLLTIAFGGVSFFVIKPIFYKTRRLSEKVGDIHKIISHYLSESTIGAKVIKIMDSQDAVTKRAAMYFNELRHTSIVSAFYGYAVNGFLEPISYAFIATLFLISYRTPTFNIAAFAVVIYLVQKMFSFIQQLQSQVQNINSAAPFLRSTLKYQEVTARHREQNPGTRAFVFSDHIAYKDVSFGYPEKPDTLCNISFTIKRGEMVGIAGPSGSGKTTFVDLLLRLFEPGSGHITIDNTDIRHVDLNAWRRHVGYVPQETFLLNSTVEQNIRFYDDQITSMDIQEAVRLAQLTDVIAELPNGLETVVGERGVKLSGGQRQRIALARALARKPDILVLDEATSSLDARSEELIQQAIQSLKGNITIIAIAHRLSTIRNADAVVVLENGHIAQCGGAEIIRKE